LRPATAQARCCQALGDNGKVKPLPWSLMTSKVLLRGSNVAVDGARWLVMRVEPSCWSVEVAKNRHRAYARARHQGARPAAAAPGATWRCPATHPRSAPAAHRRAAATTYRPLRGRGSRPASIPPAARAGLTRAARGRRSTLRRRDRSTPDPRMGTPAANQSRPLLPPVGRYPGGRRAAGSSAPALEALLPGSSPSCSRSRMLVCR
jgi:hypothetical protein